MNLLLDAVVSALFNFLLLAGVPSLDVFYEAQDVDFTAAPTNIFGSRIARFLDCEGAECSVSGS